MSFDRIPSFIQLEIVSYLNVRDAGRFMSTSCKNYLLMTEVARCNPYIVAEASRAEDNCSAKGVISRAVTKIPSKPNIVFAFYEHSIYDMKQSLERLLPSDTSVIAAEAMNVQANVDGAVTNTGGTYDDDDEGTGVSILLGSFPESISGSCIVTGSSIKNARCRTDVYASVKQILQISGLIGGQEWSTFILYACGLRGHSLASYVIEILQVSHAEAAIIGGVCDSALVRTHPVSLTSSSTISRTKSGVVVLALGGNTPLRACVSRGMEPLHAPHVQISDSFPIYNQYNNDMTNREDETSQSPIGYVVSKIRRTDSALEEETVISDWIGMSGAGDYLGIKRPDDMGYTLHLISSDLFIDEERILVKECKPLNGAEVKLFRLTSAACVQDLDDMLSRLILEVKGLDQELMGALMFSCNGRGPRREWIGEDAMDANHFNRIVGNIPLVGFYGGGEVGPKAMAMIRQGALRTGAAELQAFTVVLGVFLKPKLCECSRIFHDGLTSMEARTMFNHRNTIPKFF